jgi:diguanylate cyclase (GGDEF)-like protein
LSIQNIVPDAIALSKSLEEKEADIDLLQQTFTEIGGVLDLDKVFEIVSFRARELINAETLVIPLLDDNLETYTYRGGAGKDADEIVGESLPIDFGVCGWVWKHKKPWWKGMYDALGEAERSLWNDDPGSIILVPLQGRKHFLGGIAGIGKIGDGEFSKRDLNLLQLFASIVSIAIENAMAVKAMEESKNLNLDYQRRLEGMNKRLTESGKELEYLSLYDTLTSLPNRTLFHDRLSQNISQAHRTNDSVGLLLIDLDQFKKINEAFGHEKGDQLLKMAARRIEEGVQPTETLARLGGDEFVIILPGHDRESASERATTLKQLLVNEFKIEDASIVVSASIGVAISPEHGNDPGAILRHADTAMYTAKSNSMGVCVYDQGMDDASRNSLTMAADVRKALELKQFELHYQPKVSISSNKVMSAEALGRWTSKRWGAVQPSMFIELLGQIGLMGEYTYWAIGVALEQAKQWSKNDIFRIAVNISPHTMMNPDFISELENLVATKDNGQHLIFEITENMFLSEQDRLDEVLQCIRSMGICLSIDDYGTGYSSLSRLTRLPVAELKIDQSFVRDMMHHSDDKAIVRSTIDLAHNLGLTIVAEGVERQEEFDLLQDMGCDVVQGYLMSRPLSADDFNEYMSA